MEIVPFIAESAADAARQVRERLGPEAVVVQVRPIGGGNRGWFGKKEQPRFEVLAYRPDKVSPAKPVAAPAPATTMAPLATSTSTSTLPRLDLVAGDEPTTTQELGPGRELGGAVRMPLTGAPTRFEAPAKLDAAPSADIRVETSAPRSGGGAWRTGAILESTGFLPREAQRVVDGLREEHGERPPAALADELALTKRALKGAWRPVRPMAAEGGETHVLVGAPGVGKTTCLCKWLTQVALAEGRAVRVWRLDGQTANTAEALAVYCDVLGVPLARRWNDGDGAEPGECGFVDLPGTDWRDAGAVAALADQVRAWGRVRVHLTLNGAYDLPLMLGQVRAFSVLPIEDLIVTHLDEEVRWGKLWNLVLGTNYSLRYLGAGQNVPGEFQRATAEALMMRQFPH